MGNPVPPRKAPDEPWRTEGTPEEPPKPPPGGRKMRGGWWSLMLTALVVYLIANLILSLFNGGKSSTPGARPSRTTSSGRT
jgi:cell division protease FtsH